MCNTVNLFCQKCKQTIGIKICRSGEAFCRTTHWKKSIPVGPGSAFMDYWECEDCNPEIKQMTGDAPWLNNGSTI